MPKIQVDQMSFDECIDHSKELARQITETGFDPESVVGIANGGIVPARIVSDCLECPMVTVHVERPLTGMKQGLGLQRLPKWAKNFLRRAEMLLGFYRIMERRTIKSTSGPLSPGKCVIVDDSLDTGRTVAAVIQHLAKHAGTPRNDIRIAVLTQIFDDAHPPADHHIFRNVNFCFPWSMDSQEYHKFVEFRGRP